MIIVYGVHEADGQNVTVMEEIAYSIVTGGGGSRDRVSRAYG